MPRVASSTGLVAARIRPVSRPKKKQVDLSGSTKPAPFVLRPFSGLFNPYPYGCSVLCNHPADGEAKDVVRRAKDCWATEGKALLLPAEMELIRATLLAGGRPIRVRPGDNVRGNVTTEATTVPEELFRRYTETDSRPLTPAPTLASGPVLYVTSPDTQAVNPRERTTLVLDLRANSQDQDIETLSWHALSLEPLPSPRRNSGVFVSRPTLLLPLNTTPTSSLIPAAPPPTVNVSNASTPKNSGPVELHSAESDDEPPMRRRGKRLRKRKCRRGSTYGQQTEVRDPPEPLETQVSQVDTAYVDNSSRPSLGDGTVLLPSNKEPIISPPDRITPKSFIDADILKHLGRQLDRDTVEGEFSLKRRIALEEALRVKGELSNRIQTEQESEPSLDIPRVFSRQSSRFEIPLDSRTLGEMSSLEYLSCHVFVTPGRKLIFRRAFNRYFEDVGSGVRRMLPDKIPVALKEVMGRPLTDDQSTKFKNTIGEVDIPVDFRTWCGICAAAERLLAPLPPREADPPTWIERVDLEGLERRLKSVDPDPKLAHLLTEIRDR